MNTARGLARVALVLGLTHADPQRAGLVLGAVAVAADAGYDRAAMIGHVALWDPLFALWGCGLLGSLWRSRCRR